MMNREQMNALLEDLLVVFNKHNVSFNVNRFDVLHFDAAGSAVNAGYLKQDQNWEWEAVSNQQLKP